MTLRPTEGLSYQGSYTWSKAISGCGNVQCTTWINAVDRSLNRNLQASNRTHGFRLSGVYELPFGPNRRLLGKSTGVLARLAEQWQLSFIVLANSGVPLDIGATNTYVGSSRPDIVGPFAKDLGKAHMTGGLPGYFEEGAFRVVSDPQCDRVTTLQDTRTACTLRAVADSQSRIVLQHSRPGTLGNLGSGWLSGPGRFSMDMSASKTVRIGETKSFQIRVDAKNVLNRPYVLASPDLNMNSSNFGQFSGDDVLGSRQFQGQLRFSF